MKLYEHRYLATCLSTSCEINETNPNLMCVLGRTAPAHWKQEFVQIWSLVFSIRFKFNAASSSPKSKIYSSFVSFLFHRISMFCNLEAYALLSLPRQELAFPASQSSSSSSTSNCTKHGTMSPHISPPTISPIVLLKAPHISPPTWLTVSSSGFPLVSGNPNAGNAAARTTPPKTAKTATSTFSH